jgi:methionyl aminopeptidase
MKVQEQYRTSGRITREVRDVVAASAKPGASVVELCETIESEMVKRGGRPAFPTGIGVNHVTAHYAPQEDDKSVLNERDLVKVDYGVHVDGYVTDTSITLTFNPEHELMIEAAKSALQAAIEAVKRDKRVGEVGREILRVATRFGFKTIQNLTGHTLERFVVHAGKSIPNLYMPNMPSLKEGEVFAIEPFLTLQSAAGYVVDSPSVTIFSVAARKKTGERALDDFVTRVWDERKTLPFTPRWYAADFGRGSLDRMLKELVRRRVVKSYPTLVEASGSPVAQFEHTMALEDGELLVLT